MTLPTTTRAAVLSEHGKPLQVVELPLPDTLGAGEVLAQVTCATLCGSDVEIWAGKMSFPGMLPLVLGHEMVGEIMAVGEGALDMLGAPLRVGDRIGWSESACGRCYGCAVLREPVHCEHRGYGFLQRSDVPPYATAGLAQHAVVVKDAPKLRLPEGIKDTWAAIAGCAAKTTLRAFDRAGGVRPGSQVAVQGAGAIGLFATAVAKISGAAQVITIGGPESRLDLARNFGADHTINIEMGSEKIVEAVLEATGGAGADVIFDFAGAPSVGAEAIGMAAKRGVFVVVGSTGPISDPFPLSAVMRKELTVVGSINGDFADYHRAITFFEAFADRYPWDMLFSPACGLDGASAALERMHEQSEVKAVIDPRLTSA